MNVTATKTPRTFQSVTLTIELTTQDEFDTWYQMANHGSKVNTRLEQVRIDALSGNKVDVALDLVWRALQALI
jgi:uncharacterized glyoxalase superfamily protein PhnB